MHKLLKITFLSFQYFLLTFSYIFIISNAVTLRGREAWGGKQYKFYQYVYKVEKIIFNFGAGIGRAVGEPFS